MKSFVLYLILVGGAPAPPAFHLSQIDLWEPTTARVAMIHFNGQQGGTWWVYPILVNQPCPSELRHSFRVGPKEVMIRTAGEMSYCYWLSTDPIGFVDTEKNFHSTVRKTWPLKEQGNER